MGVIGRFGDAALLGGLAVGAVVFDLIFVISISYRPVRPDLLPSPSGEAIARKNERPSGAHLFLLLSAALRWCSLHR